MARAADPVRARAAATWIVRRLRDSGHTAYFAGGCVRDGLLGLHPTDYDVATDATPVRVRSLFNRTAEVGAAFGVVLVTATPSDLAAHDPGAGHGGGSVTVEVATFRADGPYTDARRPDRVTFSDPRSDAERRDFTINALFLDPLAPPEAGAPGVSAPGAPDVQGRIIDYVGGVEDLSRRVVRAVGDPDKRLAEDHLRALRAVRFAARLGFEIDPSTAAAISRHAASLRGVSRERIGDEVRRMLAHPARAAAITTLQNLGLDAPVLREPHACPSLRLLGALPAHAALATALAAWALDRVGDGDGQQSESDPIRISSQQARETARRYREGLCLSNEETDALRETLSMAADLSGPWSKWAIAAQKRLFSKSMFDNSLQIVRAASPSAAAGVMDCVRRFEGDGIGICPDPLLTGDHLVLSGFTPSPRFKGILDAVYDAQLEGRVQSLDQAMELARTMNV